MYSTPRIILCAPTCFLVRYSLFATERYKISFTSVDLPEPDTPVTHTNRRNGISTSMFLRLCAAAPLILILGVDESTFRRFSGSSIFNSPLKYFPVREAFALPISFVPPLSGEVRRGLCVPRPCVLRPPLTPPDRGRNFAPPSSRVSSVPEYTISPPCFPAPGPISTTQSLPKILSSSCSTTIMVLPMSHKLRSVETRCALSFW